MGKCDEETFCGKADAVNDTCTILSLPGSFDRNTGGRSVNNAMVLAKGQALFAKRSFHDWGKAIITTITDHGAHRLSYIDAHNDSTFQDWLRFSTFPHSKSCLVGWA